MTTVNQTAADPAVDQIITLTDLQNVLVIIELASSRGAFRASELQPVGQLFDKIDRFVKSTQPPVTENTPSQSIDGQQLTTGQ